MKFAENRPVKIVMLGAGGTGGHIAPHLYRLLYALERPVRFIICDGDIVEEKNLVRQNFTPADLGENKAKVLAELWGDRIFEKCGIRRDEGGDGGKTLEIRGKRRLSARDGGANYQQS